MLTAALIAMAALTALPGPALAQPPLPWSPLASLPAEPGAQVLTDAPTAQAVVVDLDGDGRREIAALTVADDGSVAFEAWSNASAGWAPIGAPVPIPSQGGEPGPLRLLVRATGEGERLTLARQPLVPEASEAEPCCLHLEDVVARNGRLEMAAVITPLDAVDALLVIDLDGDGVDELLGSRSLAPFGDVSYPTAVTILRWGGTSFEPLAVELPVGSGDTPFILGDTDGVPGEELGILATIGRPAFHRVAFEGGRAMRVEDARLVPLPVDVLAAPAGDRPGLVLLSADGLLELRSWPANETVGNPIARTRTRFAGSLIATVDLAGRPVVALRQSSGADALHMRQLPMLTVPPAALSPVGPAAPAFAGAPVPPYVGPLPGGGPDGHSALVVAGRFVAGTADANDAPMPRMALLAGAAPIGLAGADSAWLAIHHLPAVTPSEPSGGRLDPVLSVPGSGITVAPLDVAATPEAADATFEPPTIGGIAGQGRTLAVGPSGFRAVIEAPPGSRIHVAGLDPAVVAAVQVVGADGRAEVPMLPPVTGIPNPRYRAALSVTTPAGHSYVAVWDVRVTTEPPPIEATATTPFGSGDVVVRGSTDVASTVSIDGTTVPVDADGRFEAAVAVPPWPTAVVVAATGPFGAESRQVLSAVGFLDYRSLPWVAIVAACLALVAVVLAVRVPQRGLPARRADDDAVLEELDPDGD